MNSKKNYTLGAIIGLMSSGGLQAAQYSLANESGDFKARMTAAVAKARSGDTILVDKNYTVGPWYTVTKSGLTIKGNKTLRASRNHSLKIRANNTTVDGLTFVNGNQSVTVDGGGTRSNLTFKNITIKGSGYAGLFINDTNIDRLTITGSRFEKSFGVLMEDSSRFTNVLIKDNQFFKSSSGGSNGHELSLDCAEANGTLNHSNIRIVNNKFHKTQAFNIALANMASGFIAENNMYGGTNTYSQCVHIEDRTANTYIKRNNMWNTGGGNASHAVILYATDRSGRANGAVLTDAQKRNEYAPRNITLENNKINQSGSNGVKVIYLKSNSQLKFYGQNTINADDQAISKGNQVSASQVFIADRTRLKGKAWSNLKNQSPAARRAYINF